MPWPSSLPPCLLHVCSLRQATTSTTANIHMLVGQQVPAEQLSIGTSIMVKPGDGVPADGIVVLGASRIDESMLTGEPAPVSKKIEDKVR